MYIHVEDLDFIINSHAVVQKFFTYQFHRVYLYVGDVCGGGEGTLNSAQCL